MKPKEHKDQENIETLSCQVRMLVCAQDFEQAELVFGKMLAQKRFFSFKKESISFAKAYSDLAMSAIHNGHLEQAERQLSLALDVFEKYKIDGEYATAANRLGMVYRFAGALESAEEMHYRAKKIAIDQAWETVLAETYGNLGMIYEAKENIEVAIECHCDALNLYQKNNAFFETAIQYRHVGICFMQQNQFEKALEAFLKAQKMFEKQNNFLFQARIYNDLAILFQKNDDLATARTQATLSVKCALKSKNKADIAQNKILLATLKMLTDPTDPKIEPLLKSGIAYFETTQRTDSLANAYATLGLTYLRRHDWAHAKRYYKSSVRIEERLLRTFGMASDYGNLGLICEKMGEQVNAIEYYNKAKILFEQGGHFDLALEFDFKLNQIKSDQPTDLFLEQQDLIHKIQPL